jgi:acyl carrier protein
MSNSVEIKNQIFNTIISLVEDKNNIEVSDDTQLIGNILDSMKLVELCILLEDMAAELGFEFDWTSNAAMSRSRSMFRTAGTLASEFVDQMRGKP